MDFLAGANLLVVILGFGFLILIHELGHLLAAKWAGIRCENFAIGMGPIICSYRKGIGLRLGSTQAAMQSRFGRPSIEVPDSELQAAGVNETEYTLRALPLGGFVQMLGQDDMNPGATSTRARSYQSAPIGKRMVVISGGVVANVVTAFAMFIMAFLLGVKFEAPVVGALQPGGAGARAGIHAGDRVLSIDDSPIATFSDIQIASALSTSDKPLRLRVERAGKIVSLEAMPEQSGGMRALGVWPASGCEIDNQAASAPVVFRALSRAGFWSTGSNLSALPRSWAPEGAPLTLEQFTRGNLHAKLETVGGVRASSYADLRSAAEASAGQPIVTTWSLTGGAASAPPTETPLALSVQPDWPILVDAGTTEPTRASQGLLGWIPLTRIEWVSSDGTAAGLLEAGDLILRVGDIVAPDPSSLKSQLQAQAGKSIQVLVLREGKRLELTLPVGRKGVLGVLLAPAWELLTIGQTFSSLTASDGGETVSVAGAAALPPMTSVVAVNGVAVATWPAMLAQLKIACAGDAPVRVSVRLPSAEASGEVADVTLALTSATRQEIAAIGWTTPIDEVCFEPMLVTLTATGNPLQAVGMGLRESGKVAVLTYLTLDRLFRGTVGVDQLRGPVGIVHIGTRATARGVTYMLFFLAMISVNLAVLNFLPLPVVDGGHMIFLCYEKITGKPPSPAFQHYASMAGLALLGGVFLITFYNDIARLIG